MDRATDMVPFQGSLKIVEDGDCYTVWRPVIGLIMVRVLLDEGVTIGWSEVL